MVVATAETAPQPCFDRTSCTGGRMATVRRPVAAQYAARGPVRIGGGSDDAHRRGGPGQLPKVDQELRGVAQGEAITLRLLELPPSWPRR